MANEINAVAGQLWGIPMGEVYTAGPGIKIDNVHKIVSVDETVLWEGSMYLNNDSGSLSESISNFESVAIYGAPVYGGGLQRYEFLVDTSGTPAYRLAMPAADGVAAYYAFFNLNISSTATVTRSRLVKIMYSDGSVTTADFTSSSTLKAYIKKIVGINRKSA